MVRKSALTLEQKASADVEAARISELSRREREIAQAYKERAEAEAVAKRARATAYEKRAAADKAFQKANQDSAKVRKTPEWFFEAKYSGY